MRPRERFARHGPDGFGDDELLALIIGTGSGRLRAIDIARSLLTAFGGLSGLTGASVAEVEAVPGIGLARAVQLLAGLRVGRRALLDQQTRPLVASTQDAWQQLAPLISGQPQERLAALYISHSRRLLAARVLTQGNDLHTIVDPRQIFRPAIRCGATGVILAHNHPGGAPLPSAADLTVTRRLAEAGIVVGVELLDHLILGGGGYTSLAEQGVLVRPLPGWRPGPLRV